MPQPLLRTDPARGRDLRRPLLVRIAGRLLRRPEPRAADDAHAAVLVAARRAGLPEALEPDRGVAGRRAGARPASRRCSPAAKASRRMPAAPNTGSDAARAGADRHRRQPARRCAAAGPGADAAAFGRRAPGASGRPRDVQLSRARRRPGWSSSTRWRTRTGCRPRFAKPGPAAVPRWRSTAIPCPSTAAEGRDPPDASALPCGAGWCSATARTS